MNFFEGLHSYSEYLDTFPFHLKLGVEPPNEVSLRKKAEKKPYFSVDPEMKEAFPAELDDLIRLHYLVTSRKVSTILEFGVGKSTVAFDDALIGNKRKYEDYLTANLRRTNPFECHSVDNNPDWIEYCMNSAETEHVTYVHADCEVSTFSGRICTYFDPLPNICPDLIYVDGPDQFSPQGSVRGISTRHPDGPPKIGDLLSLEHFLLPGTLIVVDGRSANARFMKSNFQRNWSYDYFAEYDQHFFELLEEPLGIFNKRQIDFSLGENFYSRMDTWQKNKN